MILKIVLGLAVLLAGFLVFVSTRPGSFRIERSLAINAPARVLYPLINDLRAADAWSPWKDKDPNASYTYDGPATGVGSSQSWSGNNDVGAGKQTIVECRPDELVRLKVEFYKPMEGICDSTFALQPDGGGVRVTWTMSGENNFVGKLFCVFVNQDKMIGTEFEKGLANLKRVAEVARVTTP